MGINFLPNDLMNTVCEITLRRDARRVVYAGGEHANAVGFNQNYYRFTLILRLKFVLRREFLATKFIECAEWAMLVESMPTLSDVPRGDDAWVLDLAGRYCTAHQVTGHLAHKKRHPPSPAMNRVNFCRSFPSTFESGCPLTGAQQHLWGALGCVRGQRAHLCAHRRTP